jgi:hypothetical protein
MLLLAGEIATGVGCERLDGCGNEAHTEPLL